jgi:hypothetical protein
VSVHMSCISRDALCQGTTLVVPSNAPDKLGFSPCARFVAAKGVF